MRRPLKPAEKMAREYFPYANIRHALTISGLISHRFTSERETWARVIAGSDEQLAAFIETKIPLSPVNFGAPSDAAFALARYLVPEIERVLVRGVAVEETRAWYRAFVAGATLAKSQEAADA